MLPPEDLLERARSAVGPFRAGILDDRIQGWSVQCATPGSRLNITSALKGRQMLQPEDLLEERARPRCWPFQGRDSR
jgi:hypothetical protein